MYAYIEGTLESKLVDSVVIGTVGGVGYRVFVPMTDKVVGMDVGEKVKLFTHMYVRENIVQLYGFSSTEKLQLFELLITVSGIGAKVAIAIISDIAPHKFSLAVIGNDYKSLTAVSGVGPKMAQRIILELKDKMKADTIPVSDEIEGISTIEDTKGVVSEAVEALQYLGYAGYQAKKTVSEIYVDGMSVEEIIKEALKKLSN